jgi:hypothetical protein
MVMIMRPADIDFYEIIELNTDDRLPYITNIVTDYFEHFNIEPPNDFYLANDEAWEILFNSDDRILIASALDRFWSYANNYHKLNTKRLQVKENITKNTILKLIKKSFVGSRIDEMGIDGTTTSNIKAGFIGENVLNFIIDSVLTKPSPDLFVTFGTIEKINFIKSKMIELKKG